MINLYALRREMHQQIVTPWRNKYYLFEVENDHRDFGIFESESRWRW